MIKHTEITAFLELMQNRPVIDVRSPSEYAKGHIPKAFNIPLFDDRERARVGTVYHCEGREKAVALGILIAKPKMEAIAEAVNKVGCKQVLLHCWRGGMRSEGVAQLLHDSGMQVQVLTGGYKSFRKAVLDEFVKKRKLLVLGGMTGSGKTEVLHSLKARGEQVLDLEAMANHKGSVFGALGAGAQPRQEQFENNIACELMISDPGKRLWLEDESLHIGKCMVPKSFFTEMGDAPLVHLHIPFQKRADYLTKTYGVHPPELLVEATEKLGRRIGGSALKEVTGYIQNGKLQDACSILLNYYDKKYKYAMLQRTSKVLIDLPLDEIDANIAARQILTRVQHED